MNRLRDVNREQLQIKVSKTGLRFRNECGSVFFFFFGNQKQLFPVFSRGFLEKFFFITAESLCVIRIHIAVDE